MNSDKAEPFDLGNTIKRRLAERGDDEAVWSNRAAFTGSQFLGEIAGYEAALLEDFSGKKVALSLATNPATLALFVALLSLGCNVQILDKSWPKPTMARILRAMGAEALIFDGSIDEGYDFIGSLRISDIGAEKTATAPEVSRADSARITCFSSGSTGLPKGCRRSTRSWVESFDAEQALVRIGAGESVLVIGNFAHSLFLYAAVRGLFAGARVLVFENFHPNAIVKKLSDTDKAVIFAVPTQLAALADALPRANSSLTAILSMGSKISQRLVEKLFAAFAGARLLEFYGASELSYVAAREVRAGDDETLIGEALKGVKLSIRRADHGPCASNETGLVYVDSPMMFDGYETATGFVAARVPFSAGDMGYLDQHGRLHLTGRADRMFQCAGRNILPEEIEQTLCRINGVHKAAVFGIPDEARENRIVAVLPHSQGMTKKDVMAFLGSKLAPYARPSTYLLCRHWPVTASGKTDLRRLCEQVQDRKLEELR